MEETTTRRRRESRAKRRARILRNRIIFGTACVCLTASASAGAGGGGYRRLPPLLQLVMEGLGQVRGVDAGHRLAVRRQFGHRLAGGAEHPGRQLLHPPGVRQAVQLQRRHLDQPLHPHQRVGLGAVQQHGDLRPQLDQLQRRPPGGVLRPTLYWKASSV